MRAASDSTDQTVSFTVLRWECGIRSRRGVTLQAERNVGVIKDTPLANPWLIKRDVMSIL